MMRLRAVMMVVAMSAGVAAGGGLAGCEGGLEKDRGELNRGFDAYRAQQYGAAEGAAAAYIAQHPNDGAVDEAYYLRGLARMGREDRAGAEADLQAAIARSGRDDLRAKAYRALGEMAFEGMRFDVAAGNYERALTYYPARSPDPLVLYRLGACRQALGQWDAARPYFQRVIAVAEQGDPLVQRALNRRDARGFALQFGAYGTAASANDAARQVAAAGVISAVIVPEKQEGGMMFMVRAGTYGTYAAAEGARLRMMAKFPQVRVVP